MDDEEEGEDETTILEQERHEEKEDGEEKDREMEINELNKENELSLEELLALYDLKRRSATPDTTVEGSSLPGTSFGQLCPPPLSLWSDGEECEEEEEGEGDSDECEGEVGEIGEEEELETVVEEKVTTEEGFSGVAAAAEQFQPKGITLATTEVKTKVPFLLRGQLREYQHIGLDWLVAMDERRLNGILADEMGLGKTIQTVALLAHLACEKGNWGPHLIIVPTSVMLNWEIELKKWCPAFKILTYFGSFKERKQKRVGWSKYNAFHVCITSYNIAVQDHRAFKQKRWKYLVLDEAQNIKNFKSQRWQTLLNFSSQRRLLLTGTPLQNNLMELWSLMHFLMPTVFSSHTDFKEWFSNPLTGMVEGSQEYNESIVARLHQVLRPFLLRRLKMEVERQMPKKYEHILLCRLSKRQRFLYDEYMSRSKTKETLAAGNYLSVINILMQLRKVCNHPDLFEPRPTLSPFRMMALQYYTASLVLHAMQYDPFKHVCLDHLNLKLADVEFSVEAFEAFRCSQLQAPRAYLLDPASALPHRLDLTEMGGGGGGRLGSGGEGELNDLALPGLVSAQEEWNLARHRHMHDINSLRCQRQPMYGRDLVHTILSLSRQDCRVSSSPSAAAVGAWLWVGFRACQGIQTGVRPEDGGVGSLCLSHALLSYQARAEAMEGTIRRFFITVPPATASPVTLICHHPPPTYLPRERERASCVAHHLSPRASLLHCPATAASLQFPETRLIQYDCGKLQTLDTLLQELKLGGHRVLIFTQMARMLDVLEIFLNYHGHTYLRLDGSTPPLKRQFLMDRFNRDRKIYCFILSTRSGGLGVNLTGADTVVFYDSDWNPTMDAQAQDRCHRIGQTRDVHIYRLVSERTVEENILKKASQKKLLGDIAIEGGAFTTDFFKKASLRELFKVQKEEGGGGGVVMATETEREEESPHLSQKQIEEMLAGAEDDTDVQAACRARAEETAEMAEFDEDFSTSQSSAAPAKDGKAAVGESQVQSEFASLQEQLSGVEQYAMRYLEAERAHITDMELRQAEESIQLAKKDWELTHLQTLRAEEERLAEEEAEDVLLTYDRPETANKMMVERETGEEMPMWLPPTPPAEEDEEEMYVDPILGLNYDLSTTISPAALAANIPFHVDDYDVFGQWRPEPAVAEPVKKAHQKSSSKKMKENINVPPSLFWRRMAADSLPTKLRKLTSHHPRKTKNKESFTPILEQHPEGPEWIPYEDWVLLKCITAVLEFPLSLTISVPAQIPNWSIVSDITSCISKVKRSPLQCREHLMSAVIPREGPSVKGDDPGELKRHRSKDGSVKKSKGRREQRTKSLVMADGGRDITDQYSATFSWVLKAASQRDQRSKFAWESLQKHSMHSELLKEYGIMVDVVHSPANIAHLRAERLQSVAAARAYQSASAGYTKVPTPGLPTPTDITKMGGAFGLPGNRVLPTSTTNLPPRIPLQVHTSLPSTAAMATSVSLPLSTQKVVTTPLVSASPLPSSSISHPLTSSIPTHTTPGTSVVKSFNNTPDLAGKIVPLQRHLSQQHAQFLLLRQNALQQQQQQSAGVGGAQLATSAPGSNLPRLQAPPPQSVLGAQQKVALPAGIEQLRPTVATLPLQQRFSAAVTSAANAMRSITSRSLQTEEVLALLKQQSLRMAASQTYRSPTTTQQGAQAQQLQQRETLQQQLVATRPELAKPAVVLTTDGSFSLAEQGRPSKVPNQQQGRVVQVPITTATSVPAATPSFVAAAVTPSLSAASTTSAKSLVTNTSSLATSAAPPTSSASSAPSAISAPPTTTQTESGTAKTRQPANK